MQILSQKLLKNIQFATLLWQIVSYNKRLVSILALAVTAATVVKRVRFA